MEPDAVGQLAADGADRRLASSRCGVGRCSRLAELRQCDVQAVGLRGWSCSCVHAAGDQLRDWCSCGAQTAKSGKRRTSYTPRQLLTAIGDLSRLTSPTLSKFTVKLARLPRESPSRPAPAAPSPPWARSSRPFGPCPGHAPRAAPRVGRRCFARRRRGIPRPRKERCAGARRDVVGQRREGAVARLL